MYHRKEIAISNQGTRRAYVRTQARPINIIIKVYFPLLNDNEADVSSVSPSSSQENSTLKHLWIMNNQQELEKNNE